MNSFRSERVKEGDNAFEQLRQEIEEEKKEARPVFRSKPSAEEKKERKQHARKYIGLRLVIEQSEEGDSFHEVS